MTLHQTIVSPKTTKNGHFRPDIQGLRAIAVLLVLLYHAEVGLFPGGYIGVDIFFVISGFLITGHLIRTAEKHQKINLKDFYARRVRRILPAATVVLIVSAIASLVFLPINRWDNIGSEIVASSFYLVNWLFARNTDYLNSFSAPSPLQHYWTLALEEQFYIIWPLLIVALLFGLRRSKSGKAIENFQIRRFIQIGALLITLPSLAFSVYVSNLYPSIAYFITPTRIWELGIGALVAAYSIRLEKVHRSIGLLLGVLGLVSILFASLFFNSITVFPGYAALLPTLGAAAVIVGGMSNRTESGVGIFLKTTPMLWIGNLSYSLYLWHWPIIVIATYWLGGSITPLQGWILIAISFVPAWLSFKFVENPVRDWDPIKNNSSSALKFGASLMLVSALAGAFVLTMQTQLRTNPERPNFISYSNKFLAEENQVNTKKRYGAQALFENPDSAINTSSIENVFPSISDALMDRPNYYLNGCESMPLEANDGSCIFGNPSSDYEVVLVGDSHAGQWAPAIEQIATENNWKLQIITKNSCPFIGTATIRNNQFDSSCYQWNQEVMDYLIGENRPSHVIVSSSTYEPASVDDSTIRNGEISQGYSLFWSQLIDANIDVTAILDIPRPEIDYPECVARYSTNLARCEMSAESALDASGAREQQEAAKYLNIPVIQMTEKICPDGTCRPIIGDVLVFRDGSHLTATYAESLTLDLAKALFNHSTLRFDDPYAAQ